MLSSQIEQFLNCIHHSHAHVFFESLERPLKLKTCVNIDSFDRF